MAAPYLSPQIARYQRQREARYGEKPQSWQFVEFEYTVPSSYWDEGAAAVPGGDIYGGVQNRVERLRQYRSLFHGDAMEFLAERERKVFKNFFGDIATLYTEFIMSAPPVFMLGDVNLVDTDLLPEYSLRSFTEAIEKLILDQIRYGVGLANVVNGEVEVLSPLFWFPTGEDDDIVAGPTSTRPDSGMTVLHFMPDGRTRSMMFAPGTTSGQIGGLIGVGDVSDDVGDPMAWDVIDELTKGRRVTLTPCQRDPAEGDWGWRLYEDLSPLVFEYTRRLSRRSRMLDKHQDPIMYGIPVQTEDVTFQPSITSAVSEQDEIRFYELQSNLEHWRGEDFGVLPHGLSELAYMNSNADFGAGDSALADIRKDIISTSRLPASLLGIEEFKLGSGVALRVSHSQTYLTCANIQKTLIPKLKRILLILALDEGASASTLRTFGEALNIEWKNPVQFLEDGVETLSTDDGMQDEDEIDEEEDDSEVMAEMAVRAAEMSLARGQR